MKHYNFARTVLASFITRASAWFWWLTSMKPYKTALRELPQLSFQTCGTPEAIQMFCNSISEIHFVPVFRYHSTFFSLESVFLYLLLVWHRCKCRHYCPSSRRSYHLPTRFAWRASGWQGEDVGPFSEGASSILPAIRRSFGCVERGSNIF